MPLQTLVLPRNTPKPRTLPPRREKRLQQGSGLLRKYSRYDLHLMVQLCARQEFKAGPKRPALRVVRSIDHARHAGLHNRSRAHGAGLQRHIKSRLRQSVIRNFSRRFAQHHNLPVRRWIAVTNGAVSPASQYFAPVNQQRANRHLACSCAQPRFLERHLHEFRIAHHLPPVDSMTHLLSIAQCSSRSTILDIGPLAKETVIMKELVER